MSNHSEIEQILSSVGFSYELKIGAKIREELTEGRHYRNAIRSAFKRRY